MGWNEGVWNHTTPLLTDSSPCVMEVLSCHCLIQSMLYSRSLVSGYRTMKDLVGYFIVLYLEAGLKI